MNITTRRCIPPLASQQITYRSLTAKAKSLLTILLLLLPTTRTLPARCRSPFCRRVTILEQAAGISPASLKRTEVRKNFYTRNFFYLSVIKRILSFFFSISILLTSLSMPVAMAADIHDQNTAKGWNCIFKNGVDGNAALDKGEAYSGEYSIKITNNSPVTSSVYIALTTSVPVKAGKDYVIGFAAKSQKSTMFKFTLSWDKQRDLLPFGSTFDWTEIEFEYTADDTNNVDAIFIIEGTTDGIWIDNVYFKEKGTDENLIVNGSFEQQDEQNNDEEDGDVINNEVTYFEQIYNKIKNAETFSRSEFEQVRGGFKYMPVYRAKGIEIDGDGSDWADIAEIYMPTLSTQFQVYIKDKRETDAKLKIKFAYDDTDFYMYIEAYDDIFYPVNGSSQYWVGDSVQFAISDVNDGYGTEMGLSHNEKEKKTEIYSTSITEVDLSGIKAQSSNNGDTTIYELQIPWSLFFSERPEEFLLDILYNDNDGDGRRYCVELAPGISEGKTNLKFPMLKLLDDNIPVYAWIDGAKTVETGRASEYSLYVVNKENETADVALTFSNGKTELRKIDSNGGIRVPFNVEFTEEGRREIFADIKYGEDEIRVNYDLSAVLPVPTKEQAAEYIDSFKKYKDELAELVKKCNSAGLSTDYEQVNISTIQKFIGHMEKDIEKDDMGLFQYQRRCIERLYNEAKNKLSAYLSGEDKPYTVPRYVTSDITYDGTAVYAKTEANGQAEERPVFFVGYGHFADVKRDIPIFNGLGANTIQQEIGPSSFISSKEGPAGWVYIYRDVNGILSVQGNDVHDGKYALKITNKDPYEAGKYIGMTQTVAVEPNTKYTFGGWSKVKNSDRFFMYTNNYDETVWFGAAGQTHDWQEFSYSFTTGKEETSRIFRLISSGVTEEGYLDGLYVTKEGSKKNLLENGDFEDYSEDETKFYNISKSAVKPLQKTLEDAEINNVSVCVLLSPHYFPESILNLYPEMRYKINYGFLKYNIMDERAKEVISAYLKTVIPLIKDYRSLNSICISNEPQFWSNNMAVFYKPLWVEYLKRIYSDVDAMNEAYGTDYMDFEECNIPQNEGNINMFYDYKIFNDELFSGWHKFMADIIKEIAPDIPLHAKIMQYPQSTGTNRLMAHDGTKYDNFGFLDWNGNDASNFFENLANGSPLDQILWYDLQTSIKDAPVYDSEDHIIKNGSQIYTDEINKYIIQSIWEGAIHGRAFSNIWLWEREDSSGGDGSFRGNISYRPDTVAGVGKTALDLNRLSYEVVALQKEISDVAILYSDASSIHTKEYGNMLRRTYEGLVYAGKKANFVTEDQISKLDSYKALILPRALNVKENTVDRIADFVKNGGKVLMIDENCLAWNEHAKDNDADKLAYIRQNSSIISGVVCNNTSLKSPTVDGLRQIIKDFIRDCGLEYITVIDTKTGERAKDVLFEAGVIDNKLILNLCSYSEDAAVNIKLGNTIVSQSVDLLTSQEEGEKIQLCKYVSKLLEIEPEHCFIDAYGHWGEKYIQELFANGSISGRSVSRFDPNGKLTRAEFLTMLVRASDFSLGGDISGISDVDNNSNYAKYIGAALNAGVIKEGSFRPDDKITRGEMCGLLMSFYEKGHNAADRSNPVFFDTEQCAFSEAIDKAYATGFISGYGDGSFRPENDMTRAEAAVIITKYIDLQKV